MRISQSEDTYLAHCAMLSLANIAQNDDLLYLYHDKEIDCVGLVCLTLRHAYDEEIQALCIKLIGLACVEDEWGETVCAKFEMQQTLLDKINPTTGYKLQAAAIQALAQVLVGLDKYESAMLKIQTSDGQKAIDVLLSGLDHEALVVNVKTAFAIAELADHEGLRTAFHTGSHVSTIKKLMKLASRDNRNAQFEACRALSILGHPKPYCYCLKICF